MQEYSLFPRGQYRGHEIYLLAFSIRIERLHGRTEYSHRNDPCRHNYTLIRSAARRVQRVLYELQFHTFTTADHRARYFLTADDGLHTLLQHLAYLRSEERRVGKECRSRGWLY